MHPTGRGFGWKTRLNNLVGEVTAGRLLIPIARVYMLEEAPQALKDFSSGKNGKIVVSMV